MSKNWGLAFELHPHLAADTFLVGNLPLCRVLLMNESRYPWLILVPQRHGIREIYQLSPAERTQLWEESDLVSRQLMHLFKADKLNIAALGNMVPQLHLHHIARFKTDEAWPAPVWGKFKPDAYTAAAAEALLLQLRQALKI
ncbi:HIT domain-containing protein [uncultured Thiothrix sp.]|jgi:diadenosine tetraphosphate (Ap4A) HIT family hydrolase|uniref:HIT domain-containing protein n=1 Tax=uncultured Thiothrix sp. TaxID=223185 RepID=UPI0026022679|nr:HIT domain-containing protein [uncultured Thiothrix sp.]HMT91755.1 HIT domain-containing protein [Thiolinea sp.]